MRQSVWQTGMGLLLLFVVTLLSWHTGSLAAQGFGQMREEPKKRPVVVLDAGHGGKDPGKVGVDGQLEKDINLDIVKRRCATPGPTTRSSAPRWPCASCWTQGMTRTLPGA